MAETLKYYIAYTNGLKILSGEGKPTNEVGAFFDGKTLEHITGCRENPNVVFAAVAFDGGTGPKMAGRAGRKSSREMCGPLRLIFMTNGWSMPVPVRFVYGAAKTAALPGSRWTGCYRSRKRCRTNGVFRPCMRARYLPMSAIYSCTQTMRHCCMYP